LTIPNLAAPPSFRRNFFWRRCCVLGMAPSAASRVNGASCDLSDSAEREVLWFRLGAALNCGSGQQRTPAHPMAICGQLPRQSCALLSLDHPATPSAALRAHSVTPPDPSQASSSAYHRAQYQDESHWLGWPNFGCTNDVQPVMVKVHCRRSSSSGGHRARMVAWIPTGASGVMNCNRGRGCAAATVWLALLPASRCSKEPLSWFDANVARSIFRASFLRPAL